MMRLLLTLWLALSAVAAPPIFFAQNAAVTAQLWTPADAGLTAYWLADDISGADLDPVGTWPDGVGSNDATASGSARPTLRTAYINGHNAVDFDGVDDGLDLSSQIDVSAGFTVFSVSYRASQPNNWFTLTEKDSPYNPYSAFWYSDGNVYLHNNSSTYSAASSVTGWRLVASTTTGPDVYVDAASLGISNIGGSAGSGFFDAIGKRSFGPDFTVGTHAFICVVSPTASADTIQRLEGWAAHYYGLTANLPSGHPYKLFPPFVGVDPVLWTPADAGLTAYWLADDISGADADPVGTWPDGVGSNDATASGSARPTLDLAVAGINGKAAVVFDGVDDYLNLTTGISGGANCWGMAVMYRANSAHTLLSLSTSAGAPFTAPYNPFIVSTTVYFNDGSTRAEVGGIGTGWMILVGRSDAGTPDIRLDGTDQSVTTTADSTLFQMNTLGARTGPGNYAQGSLAFVCWSSSTPSTATIEKLEGWAAHYYGLTANLPGGHPYKDSPPYKSTAFSPDDLPNLALWLDASDSSTLTLSASSVDEWRDKSGNGRHFTGSGSSRPTWAADEITFDGVDDRLTLGANGIGRNVGGMTVYAVMKFNTATPPTGSLWLHVANGTGFTTGRTVHYSGGTYQYSVGGRRLDADSFVGISGAIITTSTRLISQVFDYTNSDLFQYIDGALDVSTTSFQTSGNTSDTDSLGVAIGSRADGASSWANCSVQAILIYHEAHDTSTRAQVEAYLTNLYGL